MQSEISECTMARAQTNLERCHMHSEGPGAIYQGADGRLARCVCVRGRAGGGGRGIAEIAVDEALGDFVSCCVWPGNSSYRTEVLQSWRADAAVVLQEAEKNNTETIETPKTRSL